jgi:serine phosphatase RsbU (regulator of sigma subunit)
VNGERLKDVPSTLYRSPFTEMRRFIKDHPRLAVAGGVGLVVFLLLFGRAFMTRVRPQPLDREDVTARALAFAAAEGWAVSPGFAWTYPVEGDEAATVRETAAGSGAAVPDREALPDPAWETVAVANPDALVGKVTAFQAPDPLLVVSTTPRGEVVAYIEASSPIAARSIDEYRGGDRSPPFRELELDWIYNVKAEDRLTATDEERAAAISVAEAFFARHAMPSPGPPASFAVRQGANSTRPAYLQWQSPGPAGTIDIIRAIVWNGRVAAFDRDLRASAEPVTPVRPSVVLQILNVFPVIVLVVASAVIVVLLLLRRRQREIDLRSAATVGLANALVGIVLTFSWIGLTTGLTMPLAGHVEVWLGAFNIAVVVPLAIGIGSFLLGGAWAVGEGQNYLVWPQHRIRPFSAFLRGNFRTQEAAEPVAVGYAVAAAVLGAAVLVGLVTPASQAPSVVPYFSLVNYPILVAIPLQAFSMGLTLTITTGVFAMTYARQTTRRLWIVVLVGTLAIISMPGSFTPTQFFPGSSSVAPWFGILLAVVIAVTFVKYGPIAMMTAVYFYIVTLTSYPLVLSGNGSHTTSGVWALLLGLAPAAVATYGALRPASDGSSRAIPAHVRRALDRMRISQEFDVARQVQVQLLPAEAPRVPGLDVAGVCVPANEVGGDYFDYFELGDGRLGVAIGDVSGKGVGAAIYMTLTKSYMVTQSTRDATTSRVLARVNEHLRRNLARGTFVTMIYGVVDPRNRRLEYARAGHNPPLLVRANGEGDFLVASGVALGATGTRTFESVTRVETVDLEPGDLLLLYTDGVTEAMNLRGEEYGEERLVTLVRQLAQIPQPAAAAVDALLRDVRAFAGRAPQFDDITIVAIRVG